jgi:pyroglutamyl-peptidase
MKILISAFEPFNNEKINASLESVRLIKSNISNFKIEKIILPVVFGKAIKILDKKIEESNPDIVISTGEAGGRAKISIERVAINVNDALIKDNEGNKPKDEKVFKDGKNAYFSLLPVKKILKELIRNSIPAYISNSAGTFVCNNVMYGLLYLIDKKYPHIKGGFIHVPYIYEQVLNKNASAMPKETIAKALEVIIETSANKAF